MSIDFSRGLIFLKSWIHHNHVREAVCSIEPMFCSHRKARAAGVPVTNYGVTISKLKVLIDKVELDGERRMS